MNKDSLLRIQIRKNKKHDNKNKKKGGEKKSKPVTRGKRGEKSEKIFLWAKDPDGFRTVSPLSKRTVSQNTRVCV